MENTLPQHTGDEPSKLSFGQLKEMTNNFANEIGRGSFGIVYKGVNSNGKEIAFKKLKITGIDDSLFQKEFQNLKRLKHPNIVELVGFCNESEKFVTQYEGKLVTAEEIHTVLCFEYVSNGSLASHLHDEHTGLSWQKRYRIIKGICDGLKYLRDGLEFSVWHLDLKPDNILLGETMIPKIADFGLSKLLGEDQTRKSINSVGTRGYWPPEYVNHQIISKEFDIFSLGVIMTKVMIGSERYKSIADMPPRKFVKQVHDNWKKRLQEVLRTGSLEVHCQQVKTCIEIAMECLRPNRQERPIIKDIVFRLNETETMIGDLGLHVQEDFFPRMNIMEEKLHHTSHDAWKLSSKMIEDITNNFAEDRFMGIGSSGKYYRGVLKNGHVIVVKVPYRSLDRSIENDLKNLMRLKHQNVVQLLGFCDEEVEELADYQGRLVRAIRRHTAICLESLPNKSLHEFLFEKHDAHSWDLCFDIIKGICSGLKYLHDATIMHLDLKPETILLDEKMVPKIGSYGLSRVRNSATLGKMSTVRTIEYLPPEYITKQVISDKYDIYSLGVIIMKIVIRGMDYRLAADMDERELIEQVQDHWKRILLEIPNYPSIEEDCHQVRVCIQIAMLCRKEDRRKRPTLEDIVQKLNAVETKKNDSCAQIDQLSVNLVELCFSFDPKKAAHCSLQIHNNGDDRVAFMLVSKSSSSYLAKLPLCGVVPPRCTYTHNLTMRKQSKPPSESVELLALHSVAVADHDLKHVGQSYITDVYDEFFKKAETAGYSVQEMTLKAVCHTRAERSASAQSTQSTIKIIATQNSYQLSSIDVHPEEPLIVTTNHSGILRVWNYQTMTTLNSIEVTEEQVHAAKFIPREKWLVAGDVNGCIYVYSYDESQDVMSFDAHNSSITSLAVHPVQPFVLSSSQDDHLIKVWDWEKEWESTRVFEGHTKRVTQLKFNTENTDSFASASLDGTVKIWSIHSDGGCIITLDVCPEGLLCVDYFKRRDRWHLITGTMYGAAQIWDLEMELVEGCDGKKGCVEKLEGHAGRITAVNLFPDLSLLITGSFDGTVRLWDSEIYKLESIIGFNLGSVHAFGFIDGTRGHTTLRRMVVGCDQGIAVMEISLPSRSCTAEETKRNIS